MAEKFPKVWEFATFKSTASAPADSTESRQRTAANVERTPESQVAAVVSNSGIDARPRRALVIGNADYKNTSRLANPINDARDMRRALEGLGFQVTYLENGKDRRQMMDAVRGFGETLLQNTGAVSLFYYSGHAMQVNGENYLIPVQSVIRGAPDVEYETLPVDYLLRTMGQAKDGTSIIILDACRDNPFSVGSRGGASRGLARVDSPTGSLIVYATAPGKTADDGAGRNGTFTKHLLANIATPQLSIEEALKRVRQGVLTETDGAQTPWESSSLIGSFCFASCADAAAAKREQERQLQEVARQAADQARAQVKKEYEAKLLEEKQRADKRLADLDAESRRLEKEQRDSQKRAQGAGATDEATQARAREEQRLIAEERTRLDAERKRLEEQRALVQREKEKLASTAAGNAPPNQEALQAALAEVEKLKRDQARLEKEREALERERANVAPPQRGSVVPPSF